VQRLQSRVANHALGTQRADDRKKAGGLPRRIDFGRLTDPAGTGSRFRIDVMPMLLKLPDYLNV
jgi:hypothetical protein